MRSGKTERFEPPVEECRREVEGLIFRLSEIVNSIQEFQTTTDVSQNKKQLREVSKSIAKLQKTNVPAPEELRRLESRLLHKLQDTDEIAGLLSIINEGLSSLQTRVRGLRADSSRSVDRGNPEHTTDQDSSRAEQHDNKKRRFREFWERLLRLPEAQNPFHANIAPSDRGWIIIPSGFRGLIYCYVILQHRGRVELYIDCGDAHTNLEVFDRLQARKSTIETIFGSPLLWDPLETKRACRISCDIADGGYANDEAEWLAIQIAMIKAMSGFVKAIAPTVADLDLNKAKRPFPGAAGV